MLRPVPGFLLCCATACNGACSDLVERLGGAFDDVELEAGSDTTPQVTPAVEARPRPPMEVRAAPAVQHALLRCRLTVSSALRVAMDRYRTSVDRSKLGDGKQISVPPELAVEIETCRRATEDAREQPASLELRVSQDGYLAALAAFEPALRAVSTYYRGLQYMDDGMQHAADLHAVFDRTWQDLERSDRNLAALLWQAVTADLAERRDRLRGQDAQRVHWISAQLLLSAVELLRNLQQPARGDPKKRLAQFAGWRAGLDAYIKANPVDLPASLPDPDAARRLQLAAARVEEGGQHAIGDGEIRNGRGTSLDAVEAAVLEMALADTELR
ncbi:MAG: DUF3829 domain-containing protein [Pseudomonadota bacterium]